MKITSCRVCRGSSSDTSKRFDPVLGYVCAECHAFLLYADKALRKVGIEGTPSAPTRSTPNPEPETP